MTFRAKPVVKRSRNQWESQDRRNFLTNIAFGLVVVAALLILVVAVALAWYNDHLAAVGRVDGQAITKDELRDRVEIEDWRLLEQLRRVSNQLGAGQISQEQAAGIQQQIDAQREQVETIALERIIDNRIQARLADEMGVSVSEADIDAKLTEEATIAASRHLWIIEVEPTISDGELEPTPAQVTAARNRAETALEEIKAGKAWEDVAKTVSTDTTTREQGGDLGWIREDDRSLDEAFVEAAYALEPNSVSDVLEGEDGVFRIARVTDVADETVDQLFQTKITNDGIDLTRYRTVVRGDVIRQKLEDDVVADLVKPGPQRRVAEIFLAASEALTAAEGVKARHILYSAKDQPRPESALPTDDPAWAEAEDDARDAYERLQADPTLFDQIARTESDETQALGTAGSGGKLGDFITEDSGFIEEFTAAVLAPGLRDGQILEPFRTDFGWHVVQIMYRPPNETQLEKLKTQADGGADFAQLARDYSESQTAGAGGEVGWVARGQLDEKLIDAIFAAELEDTTEIVEIADGGQNDGLYLYKVFEEEERELAGRQLEELRANTFSAWYQEKKNAFTVQRGPDGS
jgi:parvulin-like peptidyl-prolyl isomerase